MFADFNLFSDYHLFGDWFDDQPQPGIKAHYTIPSACLIYDGVEPGACLIIEG